MSDQRPFRYEHMWERVDSLKDTIAHGWRKTGEAANLQEVGAKIKDIQKVLKDWAEKDFGSVLKKVAAARKRLGSLWNAPFAVAQQKRIKKCSAELDELLLR